jgi:pimeloyl-ACP methyl ester carboxylesterase
MGMATFVTNDGVRLSFTDTAGEKRPFVLIAGFTAPSAIWALQRRALLDAGHRVVTFDRRSHGDSERPIHGQRMARHGMDLAELLGHLELTDAILVGSSMGASTIWAYLDLNGAGQIAGYVDIDQTPRMINTDGWELGFYGLTETNAGYFFAEGVPETGRGLPVEVSAARMVRLIEALGDVPASADAADPRTLPLLFDHAMQDWRDVVARADVPALFVAGRQSQLWPCEHALYAEQIGRSARALILEDCGHVAMIDQPDLVNDALIGFAASL